MRTCEGAAGQWRNAFIRMPYARELMTPRAIISDTFETAITWDRFEAFHDSVKAVTEKAIRDVDRQARPGDLPLHPCLSGRSGAVFQLPRARAPRRADGAVAGDQDAASDALIAGGGTITHHHAVGREHRPWYDRQRPDLFAAALKAAKKTLDPRGIMNPGVLIDP